MSKDIALSFVESANAHIEAQTKRGKELMQRVDVPPALKGIADRVDEIKDFDSAAQCAEDMELLQSMLKHAHEYDKLIKEYCILEAKMWIRIAGLLDEEHHRWNVAESKAKIGTKGWNLINWIQEKSDEELQRIMGDVADGRRIENIRRDEMAVARWMKQKDQYRSIAENIAKEYRETGKTECNAERFYSQWNGTAKPKPKDINTWVNGMRNELLKAGAVGLGDGSGTYINASGSMNRDELNAAMVNRLAGIVADIRNLTTICAKQNVALPNKSLRQAEDAIRQLVDAAGNVQFVGV